jgi:hypothetical protein
MDETTYKILMGTSAFIVAMLGSMLATTTIPPECGLEKLIKNIPVYTDCSESCRISVFFFLYKNEKRK